MNRNVAGAKESCPRCRLVWIYTGSLPLRRPTWQAVAVVVALVAVGLLTVVFYRDAGSVLALVVCSAQAALTWRSRDRGCSDCAAARTHPGSSRPDAAGECSRPG